MSDRDTAIVKVEEIQPKEIVVAGTVLANVRLTMDAAVQYVHHNEVRNLIALTFYGGTKVNLPLGTLVEVLEAKQAV
jgi:hypothetical protein